MPRRADVPCIRCGLLVPTYPDSAPADRRRCGRCVKADAARWEHGTRTGYRREGCTCDECRAWAANEAREYRAEYRERTGTGLRTIYRRASRQAGSPKSVPQSAIASTPDEPWDESMIRARRSVVPGARLPGC
jgi:hypothetical protein